MPDKKDFGYPSPDVLVAAATSPLGMPSTAMFWMLNTIGYHLHWHWKHLGIWQGNVAQFNESSTYLSWPRCDHWLYSAQTINGYTPYGMNNLSVLDVPLRTLGLGNRLHVPDLLTTGKS